MNEEEKKAIELLENIKDDSWTTKYIMSSDSKNAEILLNLIEKLQKENEEKDIVIDLMTERACLTVEEMKYIERRKEVLIRPFNLYREIKRIFYNKARGIKNEI